MSSTSGIPRILRRPRLGARLNSACQRQARCSAPPRNGIPFPHTRSFERLSRGVSKLVMMMMIYYKTDS
jgi:hypothetical protein